MGNNLTFDETPEIDIRDLDKDFTDALAEIPLDEDPFLPEMGGSSDEEDSVEANSIEASDPGGYAGAGMLLGLAAAGSAAVMQRFGGFLNSGDDDDDAAGAVLSEIIDADDVASPAMALGRDSLLSTAEQSSRNLGAPIVSQPSANQAA